MIWIQKTANFADFHVRFLQEKPGRKPADWRFIFLQRNYDKHPARDIMVCFKSKFIHGIRMA